MTSRANKVGVIILIAIGCGLGYAGWRMLSPSGREICEVCNRPIHAQSRTVGEIDDGEEEVFCCPTCALTAHHQTSMKVKIIHLTDFDTDRPLAPDGAYVVEDSTLNLCIRHQPLADRDKQPAQMAFDRCSPSIYAFASEAGADRFARDHGGIVRRFQELATAYQQ